MNLAGHTKRRRAVGPNDGSVRRHTGTDPSALWRATISLPAACLTCSAYTHNPTCYMTTVHNARILCAPGR